jgi:hypothetical protein
MTRLQRARRIYIWRGSAIAITGSTIWMLASAYAGHITG